MQMSLDRHKFTLQEKDNEDNWLGSPQIPFNICSQSKPNVIIPQKSNF